MMAGRLGQLILRRLLSKKNEKLVGCSMTDWVPLDGKGNIVDSDDIIDAEEDIVNYGFMALDAYQISNCESSDAWKVNYGDYGFYDDDIETYIEKIRGLQGTGNGKKVSVETDVLTDITMEEFTSYIFDSDIEEDVRYSLYEILTKNQEFGSIDGWGYVPGEYRVLKSLNAKLIEDIAKIPSMAERYKEGIEALDYIKGFAEGYISHGENIYFVLYQGWADDYNPGNAPDLIDCISFNYATKIVEDVAKKIKEEERDEQRRAVDPG